MCHWNTCKPVVIVTVSVSSALMVLTLPCTSALTAANETCQQKSLAAAPFDWVSCSPGHFILACFCYCQGACFCHTAQSSPDVPTILLPPQHPHTYVCHRARLHEVLAGWDPILKPDPYLERLGQAFVQRLAKDSRILQLPEDLSTPGCKQTRCPGCPKCVGSIWRFKTMTVANLYTLLCK